MQLSTLPVRRSNVFLVIHDEDAKRTIVKACAFAGKSQCRATSISELRAWYSRTFQQWDLVAHEQMAGADRIEWSASMPWLASDDENH